MARQLKIRAGGRPLMKTVTLSLTLFLSSLILSPITSKAAEETVFLGTPYQGKKGQLPACTAFVPKYGKKKVGLRDTNKNWPKFSISNNTFESIKKYSDFSECLASTPTYLGRYSQPQITSFLMGNLTPGMPYEFASMLLGPVASQSISSYLDPVTGKNKTYTFYVWNNQKKRSMLGAAVAVAGAATGLGAAAGAVSAVQVASVATTAASAAYSIESLKSYKIVTIQVDEKGTILSFSSN